MSFAIVLWSIAGRHSTQEARFKQIQISVILLGKKKGTLGWISSRNIGLEINQRVIVPFCQVKTLCVTLTLSTRQVEACKTASETFLFTKGVIRNLREKVDSWSAFYGLLQASWYAWLLNNKYIFQVLFYNNFSALPSGDRI